MYWVWLFHAVDTGWPCEYTWFEHSDGRARECVLLQGQALPSCGSVSPSPCTERSSCLYPALCEGYSSFLPCAQREGRRVVPVWRVSCFSSVKQITLVVAACGCYRSHSAVELGRINEHHPQSPALTAGKSFLGSQLTLWSLLLEDPRPEDARMPHLDLADSCSENSCKWRLKCY